VEENVDKALLASWRRDEVMAREVIDADSRVDDMEVELEEECLKVLALHQPVAKDLRLMIAILKINNDLERIGDQAVNIAKRVRHLSAEERLDKDALNKMADIVRKMLRTSLDSLVDVDVDLGNNVLALDDEVDELNRSNFKRAIKMIRQNPEEADEIMGSLTISRNLERIADLATNIAEDVIYLISGEIIRHPQEPS
jgi:phosphate transport system protein